MRNEIKLDAEDVKMLAEIKQFCNNSNCENCIFYHNEHGCLFSRVKDVITRKVNIDRMSLHRVIENAVEAIDEE